MSKSSIVIIGGGFCGFITAYHLVKKSLVPLDITLINAGYHPARGIAYGTSSEKFLLNVPAAKMSAFPDEPDHFLNWLHHKHPFNLVDKEILGKMFVPRFEYGNYLEELFNDLQKHNGTNTLRVINDYAEDVIPDENTFVIKCRSGMQVNANHVVLATGNEIPGNPSIDDPSFYASKNYYNNPWNEDSFKTINPDENVLIVGNGLTMVDTVLGLMENHCNGTIYSLSPHGFTILPHRHAGLTYTRLLEEIKEPVTLNSLFTLFHKHTKILRHFGLSAEPVVDSIRPLVQQFWKKMSTAERKRFLTHVRHLWGVARHRLPLHIHDLMQNLRIQNKLIVFKGKLKSFTESKDGITVTYYDGKLKAEKQLKVGRVINCTGPSLNIFNSRNPLIQNLVKRGLIRPDELFLGIDTDNDGHIIDACGKVNTGIYTLGGNLRGLLWESTAVPELRVQAANLSAFLLKKSE